MSVDDQSYQAREARCRRLAATADLLFAARCKKAGLRIEHALLAPCLALGEAEDPLLCALIGWAGAPQMIAP